MIKSALLVLEDGTQFHGRAIGATGSAVGEVIFNTSTTDYQETLTDPSYSRQIVTLTYPHIGNIGTNDTDEESSQVHAQGLMIRDLSLIASNSRNIEDLFSYLKCHNIVAITDIDTRKLMRLLREKGAQNGCIIAGDNPDAALVLEKARAFSGPNGVDLVKEVTTAESYNWTQESWTLTGDLPETKEEDELPYRIVAHGFGAKRNVLHVLMDRGYCLTITPVQIFTGDALKMNPGGILLSNGPGGPALCDYAVTVIQKFLETNIPVLGTRLGHQLLVLANGAKIVETKLDRYGGNHPVKDVEKNVMMITVQNHDFAVDKTALPANLCVTHKSLFGSTLQGIRRTDKLAFSFQGHPEVGPGPRDAAPLFGHLIALIEQYRKTVK